MLSEITAAVLDEFGEEVTLRVGGVETQTTGIYRAPWTDTRLGNVPFEHPEPTVAVPQAAWDAAGARAGDAVVVQGRAYVVVSDTPTAIGLREIKLRAFA